MERPDLIAAGKDRLSRIERAQIRFIRQSFDPGRTDRAIRWCQRTIGSTWIHHCTKHLRHIHGAERLPELDAEQSYIIVSNHRSFFDLYVVIGDLVRRGMPHRIVFPVRAPFWYETVAGFLANGAMSFFAMYPPIFRDKERQLLNVLSLEELTWLLRQGGTVTGLHPEGTRNKDGDPYSMLPAQPGIGKVIHAARVPVIPVFVNGLINDLPRQIRSNFDGTGTPIHVVFGAPIDFGAELDKPGSLRGYKRIADRCRDAILELGQEEKRLRAAGDGGELQGRSA